MTLIAGVDEVGRGALFGPVVAAAVTFYPEQVQQLRMMGVKDSKQLSKKRRLEFSQQIKEMAKDWCIGEGTVQEIDRINILQASLLAMKRAVVELDPIPDFCLVDGRFPLPDLPIAQKSLIKGDIRSPIIAAASIVAKVWRDDLIIKLGEKYPHYGLASNKGYGTKYHRLALQQYGPSPDHRLSFRPCQLNVL